MTDARFEDGGELPLYLKALDEGAVEVVSALAQDAVFPITEMKWDRRQRTLALLLNRFRWEDKANAEKRGRPYERVQSVLLISDVLKVSSQGIDRNDPDTILSLLSLTWTAGEDGTGRLELILAGDGAIAAEVECLDLVLKDVTRPYKAPSGKAPGHE
ncbi:DUF2948 family protein [Alphaproteobacteria bacterium KMM 3653]|uniref:DUF2948 family protein n=1 Tax=Harenicola maris TaxID=2841044 RepID=A0AAP2CSE3_9RHOB|nr:DUF2948 family protein [Harenicola maris]